MPSKTNEKTEALSLRVPVELKKLLLKAAQADHRTLNSYVIHTLFEKVKTK